MNRIARVTTGRNVSLVKPCFSTTRPAKQHFACLSPFSSSPSSKIQFNLLSRPYKCSTTTTLAELFKATNVNNITRPKTYHASNPVVNHDHLPTPEDVLKVNQSDYTKIMFFRHPMDRLISAWTSRVKNPSQKLGDKVSKFFC